MLLGHLLPNSIMYDGFCRNSQNDKSIIDFISVNVVDECYQNCIKIYDCKAFAFNSKTTIGLSNCNLYRIGPYIKGTGDSGVLCYVIQGSKICD